MYVKRPVPWWIGLVAKQVRLLGKQCQLALAVGILCAFSIAAIGQSDPLAVYRVGSEPADAAFSPGGDLIAVAARDGAWLFTGHGWSGATLGPREQATAIKFSPNGEILVVGYANGQVRLFDPRSRAVVGSPLSDLGGQVEQIAFEPTGKKFVVATAGMISVWDLTDLTQPVMKKARTETGYKVECIALSRDGHTVIWSTRYNLLWQRSSGSEEITTREIWLLEGVWWNLGRLRAALEFAEGLWVLVDSEKIVVVRVPKFDVVRHWYLGSRCSRASIAILSGRRSFVVAGWVGDSVEVSWGGIESTSSSWTWTAPIPGLIAVSPSGDRVACVRSGGYIEVHAVPQELPAVAWSPAVPRAGDRVTFEVPEPFTVAPKEWMPGKPGDVPPEITVRWGLWRTTLKPNVPVPNRAPIARLVAPSLVVPGETVLLDGSGSEPGDVGDRIVEYIWDIAGTVLRGADRAIVSWTFAQPGSYPITLHVVDAFGGHDAIRTVVEVRIKD